MTAGAGVSSAGAATKAGITAGRCPAANAAHDFKDCHIAACTEAADDDRPSIIVARNS
jgi:hypothetical protein